MSKIFYVVFVLCFAGIIYLLFLTPHSDFVDTPAITPSPTDTVVGTDDNTLPQDLSTPTPAVVKSSNLNLNINHMEIR